MGVTKHRFRYAVLSGRPQWLNLSDVIKETLQSWSLDNKNQVCLTTDNDGNILRAVKTILGWTHLPCFGHNLNLAI